MKITERKLTSLIIEEAKKLFEGIDVTLDRKVTMTDTHERLVDTSLRSNPSTSTDIIDGITVWSIFKRKEGQPNQGDGNPLLYALKKEKGYTLTNTNAVKERIEEIAEKFSQSVQGLDVTIMVPSSNELNRYFASVIARKCSNPIVIGDVMLKMTVEEVDDYIFQEGSSFRRHYGNKFHEAYKIFKNYCRRMRNGFQFHLIYDIKMRSVIEKTIRLNDPFCWKHIKAINDKNVIIVDDSITLGNTLRECCKIVKENYSPKSITVLTLFSPLYNRGGDKRIQNI